MRPALIHGIMCSCLVEQARGVISSQMPVVSWSRPSENRWTVVRLENSDAGKNPAALALSKLGASKGGKARAAKLSAAKRKAIARKAAKARWR